MKTESITKWNETTLDALTAAKSQSIEPAKMPDSRFELYSVPSHPTGRPEMPLGAEIGSNKQIVKPRSVLLCKINPRINRVWVVGDFSPFLKIASTEWIVFPEKNDVHSEFLCYYLQQEVVRDFLAANASGVGGSLTRVKPSTLKGFPFRYPSLHQQRAIVDALETQLSRLEAGVSALKRAQANLKRYRAAVLKAACEGKLVPQEADLARTENRDYESGEQLLTNILYDRQKAHKGRGVYKEPEGPVTKSGHPLPHGWVATCVGQICVVGTGATPKRGTPEFYEGGTIPWVTSAALNRLFVDSADELVTRAALSKTNLSIYPPGTLLVAMYGEGRTRGKCSELTISATTNQAIAALQTSQLIRPYLKLCLLNQYEDMRRAASGGVQPNLNLSLVREIPIPLPPLAEQKRIVAEVERRLSVVDQLEATVEANLKRAARLRQSILAAAFRGPV